MTETCEFNLNCHTDKRELFSKNGFQIVECCKCHHRYAEVTEIENHVATVYSDSYFFDGKAGYPNYLSEKELLIASGKRYSEIVSKYTTPGNLLDVGCAAGFIMNGFEMAGWKCDGIEPNEFMADYGRNELKLKISTSDLEGFKSDKKYDLICLIQVLGHFYDIHKAMYNLTDLLKEDGFVLVESWNMNSSIARFLGKRWHEYSPPSVLHWFSDLTITQLFRRMNLKFVASGYPIKKINLKHAISLLNEHMPDFVFKKELFEKIDLFAGNLTVIYPLHDLKWYLFKKQIII
jgi:SAM-dependent methyltransferase